MTHGHHVPELANRVGRLGVAERHGDFRYSLHRA